MVKSILLSRVSPRTSRAMLLINVSNTWRISELLEVGVLPGLVQNGKGIRGKVPTRLKFLHRGGRTLPSPL